LNEFLFQIYQNRANRGVTISYGPAPHLQQLLQTAFMKKVILFVAISLSLITMQSCNNDKKDKENKELSASDVPAPVKSAFSAKYSTATDIRWEDAHENDRQTYKAKFMLNGKKMKAEFDTSGVFIKENEDN